MTDGLRARIAEALRSHREDGASLDRDRYPTEAYLCCADAVMAVLDREFARPLPYLDPPPEMSKAEVAAWHTAWAETFSGDTQVRVAVLPASRDAAVLQRVRDAVTALDGQLAREDTGERHVLEQIQQALDEETNR